MNHDKKTNQLHQKWVANKPPTVLYHDGTRVKTHVRLQWVR